LQKWCEKTKEVFSEGTGAVLERLNGSELKLVEMDELGKKCEEIFFELVSDYSSEYLKNEEPA